VGLGLFRGGVIIGYHHGCRSGTTDLSIAVLLTRSRIRTGFCGAQGNGGEGRRGDRFDAAVEERSPLSWCLRWSINHMDGYADLLTYGMEDSTPHGQ
jgi:hypothetical protein